MGESYPMTGGDGPCSYARNSNPQKEAAERLKAMLMAAIVDNLDTKQVDNPSSFRVVDMGCSTGPNTIIAMNSIVEAVMNKYQKEGFSNLPEFQVFFNDHVSNDFNTLFANLPLDRKYFSAGVPGSFQGRLFPKSSLNIVYSSFALQWLSNVPLELVDPYSPTYNKGKIHYVNAPAEVGKAYSAQYAKDMESFLNARAEELVPGGIMALMLPGRPDGTLPTESSLGPLFLPLEYCLIDMANEGILSEDKIDSFDIPIYSPSLEELRTLIGKNGCFTIARLDLFPHSRKFVPFFTTQECRAGLESILSKHFGSYIIEDLFKRYTTKIAELQPPSGENDCIARPLFVLLKRNN